MVAPSHCGRLRLSLSCSGSKICFEPPIREKSHGNTCFVDGGRFLEEWADPRALEALPSTFAAYDADDLGRALLATLELFRWLAIETAERWGYPYPTRIDQRVTVWLLKL